MKIISSRTNLEVTSICALHHAKYRKKQKKYIAEGLRTCSTLLQSPIKLEQLYVTESMLAEAQKLTTQNKITVVSPHVMEKISTVTTPSGILGVFTIPPEPNVQQLSQGIVLAQIADPGNMGTLIRSATAMNVSSVVIIDGVDPWNPKVIQASAGTIGYVNIFQWSWDKLLKHKQKLQLIALIARNGKKPQDISFDNALLIIGSEAHGIPADWIKNCDTTLTLPMPGKVESLNAAVAGSIALYLGTNLH